jgi:hypothetical protein
VAGTRYKAIISWLHDCLDAERSNRGIVHVHRSGVKRRRFLEGRDRALSEQTGWVDLAPSPANDLLTAALLYRRECELLHGSWIIAGQHEGRPVMAPVLLHRIQPEAVAGASFPIDPDAWRINPALFELLGLPAHFERELDRSFGSGLPGHAGMLALVRLLGQAAPALDLAAADAYPNLTKVGELEVSAAAPGLRLHPAALLLLAERSLQVRGLLDETRKLAGTSGGNLSNPLKCLLGGKPEKSRSKTQSSRAAWLPVHLSPAQSNLIESAAKEPLTLCHGPPGTGKTFTLAAAAIEHALRGEAVLIVCRSKQAANVVTRTLDEIAGTEAMSLRAGSRAALTKLRDGIDLLLSGAATQGAPKWHHAQRRERELQKLLETFEEEAAAFEKSLKAAFRRGRWFDSPGKTGLLARFQQWRHSRNLRERPLLMEAAAELQRLEAERIRLAREHLQIRRDQLLARLLQETGVRPTLRRYRNALRKRSSGAQEAALANIDLQWLLKVFPIWIVESDDLHRLLPLQRELFPLVILDEASQCDLASALPVLQRGKRALVAGDPKQLRHLSFLAEETLEKLADHQGTALDADTRSNYHFRRMSLIDAVVDRATAVHFLSEHFRSRPELIAFSNRRFYGGHLRLMREVTCGTPRPPAAEVIQVSGCRDASGVNQAELNAAAAFLDQWLSDETLRGGTSSIGFLSPLRAQADAFESTLLEKLGEQRYLTLLHRHKLTASTAHGFQGDEKDMMLLSFALTNACPPTTRRFIEREDVFNVSITRARDRLLAFCSFDYASLPVDSLLRDWMLSMERGEAAEEARPADPLIQEVAHRLQEAGYVCQMGMSVAGIAIDLLVSRGDAAVLALDLVGQRGRAGEEIPMQQLMLLQRAGLRLFPLGIAEWKTDPARCLAAIENAF